MATLDSVTRKNTDAVSMEVAGVLRCIHEHSERERHPVHIVTMVDNKGDSLNVLQCETKERNARRSVLTFQTNALVKKSYPGNRK